MWQNSGNRISLSACEKDGAEILLAFAKCSQSQVKFILRSRSSPQEVAVVICCMLRLLPGAIQTAVKKEHFCLVGMAVHLSAQKWVCTKLWNISTGKL